jgi:hypothetical protein
MSFTLGSILFMTAFAVLTGPLNCESPTTSRPAQPSSVLVQTKGNCDLTPFSECLPLRHHHLRLHLDLKHIASKERLPFSLAYFGSLGLTLFFSIGVSRAESGPELGAGDVASRADRTWYVLGLQLRSKILTLLGAIVQVSPREQGCRWTILL